MDRDEKLRRARQVLEAVENMLRFSAFSDQTTRQLNNLKRLAELEISALSAEPEVDGKGAAAN